MKRTFCYISLFVLSFTAYAQSVRNTTARFTDCEIKVECDLIASQATKMTLFYSPDNGITWLPATTVTGDTAATTTGHKILTWDCYADNVRYGNMLFKVEVPQEKPECVIINGVCWATRNVDAPGTFADNPEDYGMFYQWNRNVGWSSTDPMINSNGGSTWDSSNPIGTEWEKANDPSPAGFRVPTLAEIRTLLDTDKVSSQWTTQNGVSGRLFTDKTTNNSLFLPAAGGRYYSDGTLFYAGSYGYYWSSTQSDSSSAYLLYFYSSSTDWDWVGSHRRFGFSVRAVAE
ncbi:MAG: hypothetical protein LBN27_04880 [Prevotellaceae bacterium]|jgi:uncharacterized protein (TIGR02145 family)|nr:hypothetical protein [Prevotellaceae bacterium]